MKYLGKNKKIILLGIGLAESERNIGDWKSREIGETGSETPLERAVRIDADPALVRDRARCQSIAGEHIIEDGRVAGIVRLSDVLQHLAR